MQKMRSMDPTTIWAASMIATHLNAPYGPIVSAQDVATSLATGQLSAATEKSNAILEALFTEVSPDLILRCADEIHASLETVKQLYRQTLERGVMRSPEWEQAQSQSQVTPKNMASKPQKPASKF